MPKIRDWTWQYTTVATGTTLACTLPSYVAGDLLVAVCSADTTAQTWSSTGWTQLTSLTNTTNLGILYKIAGASETAPTVNYTSAESSNVRIVSVMDVDAVTPFNITATKNTSLARDTVPTVTTTRNNCLILYTASNSAAGVPTVIEGAVTLEEGSDGLAHSDGLSWGFQATLGITPATIRYTAVSASASVLLTLAINPPSGGATVIPAYCAGDLSIYVDPIHGTTAYNGNTALATTVTTNFTGTIGGRTLAAGTVAAAADVGINSFHSMGQITGTTTNGNYAGGVSTIATANKPNVAGKNVLVHIKPSTPKVLQTTDPISKSTAKGVAIGMASSAGNFKVWHVHGAGTAWDSAQHLPVVFNSTATAGLIQTTGTLVDTSILSFGWMISGFTVAPIWQFGSLWVLDTTTIAGGTATEPVGVGGIWKVCSSGKERMSVLQQGASQALVLQPIQFGNGGTDKLYLDLGETAIEFPQQYNVASRNVFYCSADNVAGLTYYAGATDTIVHNNAVVSSKSKFHWRIHASASASATYDFSGLSIIGAGDVVLRAVTTFSTMSFTTCTLITQNSAVISGCTITNSKILSTNLGIISNCKFFSNGTSGYAIEITAPGTYTFNGNIFTGYGANGTANAAIYNNSGGLVTLNISGGGSSPTFTNQGVSTTTIVASANVTLTGLIAGSEVRAYLGANPATSTELGGTESSTTSFNFSQSSSGQAGYIQVFALGYLPVYLPITYGSSDVSIPIQQSIDRVYLNPA